MSKTKVMNHIIPIRPEINSAEEYIEKFFKVYVDAQKLFMNDNNTTKHVEIEAKLGDFESTSQSQAFDHNEREIIRKTSVLLSNQSPVIRKVNTSFIELDFDRNFSRQTDPLSLKLAEFYKSHRFISNVNPEMFYETLSLLELQQKIRANTEDQIRKMPSVVQVDFVNSSHGQQDFRVTYNVLNDRVRKEIKSSKTHVDLMHFGFPYRITGAIEEEFPFDILELQSLIKAKGVNLIRIKKRHKFRYQYMEFCFTTVLELGSHIGSESIKEAYHEMLSEFLQMDDKQTYVLQLLTRLDPKLEIEIEIWDINYLGSFLNPQHIEAFLSLTKRFRRNVNSLFFGLRKNWELLREVAIEKTEKKEQNSAPIISMINASFERPIVGQYLLDIVRDKFKRQ